MEILVVAVDDVKIAIAFPDKYEYILRCYAGDRKSSCFVLSVDLWKEQFAMVEVSWCVGTGE